MRFHELGFNPNEVTYGVTEPEALVERFEDIQNLRTAHYATAFRFPGGELRPIDEVRRFVNKLTPEAFANPQVTVGTSSRAFQERRNPQAAVAYQNDEIVGLTHGAENASSRIQRVMSKIDVLSKPGARIGQIERNWKFNHGRQLVWTSEAVSKPEIPTLQPITKGLFLLAFDQSLAGSQWPYAEEPELIKDLATTGYRLDETTIAPVDAEAEFGEGARATSYALWKVTTLATVFQKTVETEPVVAAEIARARAMV